MPEPREVRSTVPPPQWPATLPGPEADSMQIIGPSRAEYSDVLSGPTRARVVARTAPMQWAFSVRFTAQQMQVFEDWYRGILDTSGGEFYARWIGGGRLVAFSAPYTYTPLGTLWVLSGTVVRTRIDHSVCDALFESIWGNVYRDDDDAASDIYIDDIDDAAVATADRYVDDYDPPSAAESEC